MDTHTLPMTFDKTIFDRIRIKPEVDPTAQEGQPTCEWAGCDHAATHPAPKGRHQERDYWHFCVDHVRLYNKSYNYFSGMNDAAIAAYQKDAVTGHRPTTPIGVNARSWTRPTSRRPDWHDGPSGAFAFFTRRGFRGEEARAEPPRRKLRNVERRSLEVMDLAEDANAEDIKARFKELVKLHHPDANGGDRSTESRLQEIIEAYNYLRSAGFC